MRIAFLNARFNGYDRRVWSGILFHMMAALQRNCCDVTSLGTAGNALYLTGRVIRRGILLPLGKNIDYSHTVVLSKALAGIFRRRLARTHFDVIFAAAARTELAYLETDLPIVYYIDQTARQFRDYARNLRGLTSWAVEQTEHLERRAFSRAEQIVFPSSWAAKSALQDYGVAEEKIKVIPMGANIEGIPEIQEVSSRRSHKPSDNCRLLFVGVDWERKGGAIALDALCKLRERGVNAELTVVGCSPPSHCIHPSMTVIPFLDKSIPEHRERFNQLLLDSDFMLFPTRREAYGIVCCEANAFGLPVLASDAGGVPVWDGENGILLPVEAGGAAYADAVQALIEHPPDYTALALGGRRTFEDRLNWDSWGRSMAQIFRELLAARSGNVSLECCADGDNHAK